MRKKKKASLYQLLYNYFDNSYSNSRKTISIAELMIHFRSYPSLSKRNESGAIKMLKIEMYNIRRDFYKRNIFIIPMIVSNKIYAYRVADRKRDEDKILVEEHLQDGYEQLQSKVKCQGERVDVAIENKLILPEQKNNYLSLRRKRQQRKHREHRQLQA